MAKFNIFIIGGTRFFGIDIVNSLLQVGHQVTVLTNAEKIPKFIRNPQILRGDRRDNSFLKKIAGQNKFDFIIDNIAMRESDVKDCLSIFSKKIDHYILTSTAWVYKILKPLGRSFCEEDLKIDKLKIEPKRELPEVTLNYIKGKLACEKVLVDQREVKYTIFRPCMVVGENDHNLRAYFYFQRLRDRKKIILLKENNKFQLVYKNDIAKAYQNAIEVPESVNQVFNLVPAKVISIKEFIMILGQALNIKPKFCILPREKIMLAIPNYLRNEPFNFENDLYDCVKVEKKLKISFTPYGKWIKKVAIWYRNHYRGEDSIGYNERSEEINLCS